MGWGKDSRYQKRDIRERAEKKVEQCKSSKVRQKNGTHDPRPPTEYGAPCDVE
jgi:hypothetical protein